MMTDTISIDKVTGEFQILAKGAKPINSFATFPSTRNDGGTKNGRLQYDHRQDDQSFPQHENIKQTGETIVGQEFAGDTAASATRGDMGDGFASMKSTNARLTALAATAAKPVNSFATFPSQRNDGGTKNGLKGYDHMQDPQSFPQHQGDSWEDQSNAGQSVIGNQYASFKQKNAKLTELADHGSRTSELATELKTSFAKFPSQRNDGGTKNGMKAYDHVQDPQSFPQHQGDSWEDQSNAGQSVIGNQYASFKQKNAKLSELADEHSREAKFSKSVSKKATVQTTQLATISNSVEGGDVNTDGFLEHDGSSIEGKENGAQFGDDNTRTNLKTDDAHEQILAGVYRSLSEDEDPGDFIGMAGVDTHRQPLNQGWPGRHGQDALKPFVQRAVDGTSYDFVTRKSQSTRAMDVFPKSSVAEVKKLIADEDPAVARRIDAKRAATKLAYEKESGKKAKK